MRKEGEVLGDEAKTTTCVLQVGEGLTQRVNEAYDAQENFVWKVRQGYGVAWISET